MEVKNETMNATLNGINGDTSIPDTGKNMILPPDMGIGFYSPLSLTLPRLNDP